MSNSTNNKKSNSGFNIDKMTTFVKKNAKYISAGILTVALVVVLAVTVLNNKDESSAKENKDNQVVQQEQKEDKESKDQEEKDNKDEKDEKENKEDELKDDEYEENVQPEIQELMSTYYNAYAVGDVKKLDSITESLSDMEKSYIKMINKYVESYDDITCYTKEGLEEDSYMVSVTFNMHFHDVEGGLPGMDFFYIRSNDAGELYIDNLYSSFNREIKEQKTEEEIDKLIKVFEEGEDVQQLSQEFQDKYDQVVKEDKKLKKMANTVSKAIREWKDSYSAEEDKDKKEDTDKKDKDSKEQEEKPKENQSNTDEQAGNEEQNNTNENQGDNSEEQNNQPEENQEGNAEEQNNESDGQNNEGSSINYVPEGTVLTANDGYNVRVSMNESAEIVGTTAIGDSIKVILSYAEGWTKVEWNGQTGYIRTDLLLNN